MFAHYAYYIIAAILVVLTLFAFVAGVCTRQKRKSKT